MHPLAALGALVSAAVLAALLVAGPDPEPSPDLGVADVVRIQVEAMGANDEPRPDAGVETAFRFASPGNRAATGPLPRFARMVHGPAYADLLDFERAEYGPVRLDGDRATQEVTVVHGGERRVTFVFGLSRQRGGDCDGCWMTDGVVRRDAPTPGLTRV